MPRQIMNIVMEYFSGHANTFAMLRVLAPVMHQVFARLQRAHLQEALVEWALVSMSNFLQGMPLRTAASCLACLFISVSADASVRALLGPVLADVRALELDPCLFWAPSVHFFLNAGLTLEAKHMFIGVMSSVPSSPFRELTDVCKRALATSSSGSGGSFSIINNDGGVSNS